MIFYTKTFFTKLKIFFLLIISNISFSQENILLNGDFEIIRTPSITLLVRQPGNTQLVTIDDSSMLKTKYRGTEDHQVMAMHWNYLEDSLSPGTFEMYNALQSESNNAQHGNNYSIFNVLNSNYLPNEASVSNLVGRLKHSLKAGEKYKVKFHLKFFWGNHYSKSISIGFAKEKTPYVIGIKKKNHEPIYRHNINPAWQIPEILMDTAEYSSYEFEYTAKGGENYIYIGNLLYQDKAYWEDENLRNEFTPVADFNKIRKKKQKEIQQNIYSEYAIDNISMFAISAPEETKTSHLENSLPSQKNLFVKDTVLAQTYFFNINEAETATDLSSLIDTVNKQSQILEILVTGHTDRSGNHQLNQNLSESRADFIYKKIKQHTELPITRKGYAYNKPLSKTNFEKNRRVEISLVKRKD